MILRNVFANYIGIFGHIIIAFILSPFLVHTLGNENYGIWSIIAALSGYMSLLDLGLSSAVTRYVAKYSATKKYNKLNIIINSAFLIFTIISSCIILFAPNIAEITIRLVQVDQEKKDIIAVLIIILSLDISIFILSGLLNGILGGFQRYDLMSMTALFSAIIKAILFYLFLSKGYGLVTMAYISLFNNLLVTIIYILIIKYRYTMVRFDIHCIKKKGITKIFDHSKFTFIAMISNQLIYYSDAFVIGYFLGPISVTYYTIAWSLSEYTKRFSMAFSHVFTPAFSEIESQGNHKQLKELYLAGTKNIMIFSNLLCIGLFILGGGFIGLWMGEEYQELCSNILMILIIAQFLQSPQLISLSLLQGISRHKYFSYMSMLVSFINLSLSIYLVQIYGIIGVAIATSLPQILFYGLVVPYMANRTINQSLALYFKKTYLKLLVPNLLLVGVLYSFSHFMVPDNFILLIFEAIISALCYLIAVYIFTFEHHEKSYIKELIVQRVGPHRFYSIGFILFKLTARPKK